MTETAQFQLEELKKIKGIGDKSARVLFVGGYNARKLAVAVPDDLVQLFKDNNSKLSMNKAKEMISNAGTYGARDILPPLRANEYQAELNAKRFYIPTDCNGLNNLLGGKGFASSSTAGMAGPQASGKTQVANELTVQALGLSEDAYVISFETELNTFSEDRLKQMSIAKGIEYDGSRIILTPSTRINDVSIQYYQYINADEIATEDHLDVKLIVVDSFTALFKRKFQGRERFTDRSGEFGRHLSYLEDMAKKYNALLFCTCQVYESPTSPSEYGFSSKDAYTHFGTNYIVWGGHILRHTLGAWFSVLRVVGSNEVEKNLWSCVLFDDSSNPRGECRFKVTDRGVVDA